MTKPLPRPDVIVNAGRKGPARLTAPDLQALQSVSDPALRKVLGEVLLQSRSVQSNFDAIREWFPIQPADAASTLREPGPPGEPGAPGEKGEKGAEGLPGTAAAEGTYQVFHINWPIGARELAVRVACEFMPVSAQLFVISNGTSLAQPLEEAFFSGVAMGIVGTRGTEASQDPAIQLLQINNNVAPLSLPFAPLSRQLFCKRSAIVAAACEARMALVIYSSPGGLLHSPGNSAAAAEEKVGAEGRCRSDEITAAAPSFLQSFMYSRREGGELPTSHSGIEVLPAVKVEWSAGKFGTAGAQIRFITQAEREAGTVGGLNWMFPTYRGYTNNAGILAINSAPNLR